MERRSNASESNSSNPNYVSLSQATFWFIFVPSRTNALLLFDNSIVFFFVCLHFRLKKFVWLSTSRFLLFLWLMKRQSRTLWRDSPVTLLMTNSWTKGKTWLLWDLTKKNKGESGTFIMYKVCHERRRHPARILSQSKKMHGLLWALLLSLLWENDDDENRKSVT